MFEKNDLCCVHLESIKKHLWQIISCYWRLNNLVMFKTWSSKWFTPSVLNIHFVISMSFKHPLSAIFCKIITLDWDLGASLVLFIKWLCLVRHCAAIILETIHLCKQICGCLQGFEPPKARILISGLMIYNLVQLQKIQIHIARDFTDLFIFRIWNGKI